MWAHALNLLSHSWANFTDSLGDTPLGYVAPFLVPIVGFIVYGCIVYCREGWSSVKDHFRKTLGVAFLVAVAAELIVYVPIFSCSVVNTIFKDHMHFVSVSQQLSIKFPHRLVHDVTVELTPNTHFEFKARYLASGENLKVYLQIQNVKDQGEPSPRYEIASISKYVRDEELVIPVAKTAENEGEQMVLQWEGKNAPRIGASEGIRTIARVTLVSQDNREDWYPFAVIFKPSSGGAGYERPFIIEPSFFDLAMP
jgi:hypothetical protein